MFKDVVGQQTAKQKLIQTVASERIPHAQLLLGATGGGSLALALAFASYVLCENTKNQAEDACGRCAACQKTAKLIHPDLHFSFPTVGTKVTSSNFLVEWRSAVLENPYMNVATWLQRIGAENRQGNIPVAECDDILHKLNLKVFEGTYKVLIMWMPEYLGKEGNRLLKMIEEPPDQTLFLLVAENADQILPTVLSRCQILRLAPLDDVEVTEALVHRKGLTKDVATQIALLADGDFGEALRQLETEQKDNANLFLAWLRHCWKGNPEELVQWTEDFAKLGRENQKQFFLHGLSFVREAVALQLTSTSEKQQRVRLQQDELATATNLAKVVNHWQLLALANNLNENYFHIERNANPKVLALDLSIRVHKLLRGIG